MLSDMNSFTPPHKPSLPAHLNSFMHVTCGITITVTLPIMEHQRTDWLFKITTDPTRTVADAIGVSHTTIIRSMRSDVPPRPGLVIDVARAYGYHPVTALYLAGILTPEEARPATTNGELRMIPSTELLRELLRREAVEGE